MDIVGARDGLLEEFHDGIRVLGAGIDGGIVISVYVRDEGCNKYVPPVFEGFKTVCVVTVRTNASESLYGA